MKLLVRIDKTCNRCCFLNGTQCEKHNYKITCNFDKIGCEQWGERKKDCSTCGYLDGLKCLRHNLQLDPNLHQQLCDQWKLPNQPIEKKDCQTCGFRDGVTCKKTNSQVAYQIVDCNQWESEILKSTQDRLNIWKEEPSDEKVNIELIEETKKLLEDF